jgi:hypothetical protein
MIRGCLAKNACYASILEMESIANIKYSKQK